MEYWRESIYAQQASEAVPHSVVNASKLLSLNALFMAFVELVLETLIAADVLPHIPFRIDVLFCTGLSAILATQTVVGIIKGELDVTTCGIQLAFLSEATLFIADLHFLVANNFRTHILLYRIGFLCFTGLNISLICYVAARLHLFPEFFQRRKEISRKRRSLKAWKHWRKLNQAKLDLKPPTDELASTEDKCSQPAVVEKECSPPASPGRLRLLLPTKRSSAPVISPRGSRSTLRASSAAAPVKNTMDLRVSLQMDESVFSGNAKRGAVSPLSQRRADAMDSHQLAQCNMTIDETADPFDNEPQKRSATV